MGGLAVKQSEPVNGAEATKIYYGVKAHILSKNQNIKLAPGGSTTKKPESMMSGDVDILMEADWEDRDKYMKEIFDDMFEYIFQLPGSKILSGAYRYQEKIVQVDVMFVKNIEWAKFSYWSPDYNKNQSQYKGKARNLCIAAILYSLYNGNEEFFDDGNFSYREQYVMDANAGFKIAKKNWVGRNERILKVPRKEYEFISDDPKWLFNLVGLNERDFESLESINEAIMLGKSNLCTSESKRYWERFMEDINPKLETELKIKY